MDNNLALCIKRFNLNKQKWLKICMENLSKDFQIKIKRERERERDLQAKKMNINILYPMGLKSKILQKSSLTPSRILCK
jgi:hypothetical protein